MFSGGVERDQKYDWDNLNWGSKKFYFPKSTSLHIKWGHKAIHTKYASITIQIIIQSYFHTNLLGY